MKTIFTTGQVAKICKVAPRTVSKWFDSGRLRGYRVPGSQDRRIPREFLVRFLKEHGMPLDELDATLSSVLLATSDKVLSGNVAGHGFDSLHVAASAFEAGLQFTEHKPSCVLIDFGLSESQRDIDAIIDSMREYAGQDLVIVGIVPERLRVESFDSYNFADTFRKPFDIALLFQRVMTLMAQKDS